MWDPVALSSFPFFFLSFFFFLAFSYFLELQNAPVLFCTYPVSVSKSFRFPKNLVYFHWRKIKNQVLGTQYCDCHLGGYYCFYCLLVVKARKIYVCTQVHACTHMHTLIVMPKSIWIYNFLKGSVLIGLIPIQHHEIYSSLLPFLLINSFSDQEKPVYHYLLVGLILVFSELPTHITVRSKFIRIHFMQCPVCLAYSFKIHRYLQYSKTKAGDINCNLGSEAPKPSIQY